MRDCITRTVKIYETPISILTLENGVPKFEDKGVRISASLPNEKKLKDDYNIQQGQTLVIGETKESVKKLKMSLDYFISHSEEITE